MTDKSWKLLTKLIDACGYDINQIEDEFDFDELCEDIRRRLAMTDKEAKWVSLKELLKLLKEMDVWTINTKYLHLYLDTRLINGDWHCTIRDRENDKYLSIEELKEIGGKFNDR